MTPISGNLSAAEIFLVATALAMDAFAVSLSCGPATRSEPLYRVSRLPILFGLFQGGMLAAGWFAVSVVQEAVAAVDHWIAFVLLFGVGAHMAWGAASGSTRQRYDPLQPGVLIMLSVATSIDAFAVGMGLSIVKSPLLAPAVATGAVTFALSTAAVYIGNRAGRLLGRGAEGAGGLLLIAIGVRILLDHTG